MEDAILKGVEPNVLFFLDTSSSMTMSMTGELPTFLTGQDSVMQATMPDMRDANFRAGLLVDCTYGTGTRPLSSGTEANQTARRNNASLPFVPPFMGTEYSGWETNNTYSSYRQGYTRYGKDMNNSNNIIGDPNSYYSPDPDRPYLLTFRDWSAANATTPPPGFADGAQAPPGRVGELVPNDSKMYQMKLVLWRLLSPENAEMLSRMRIGVATNFFDYISNGIRAPLYRRAPYRTDEPSYIISPYQGGDRFQAYHNGTLTSNISFPNGTGPEVYTGIPGGDYGHAETVYGGVLTVYDTNTTSQRHAYRAYFRVPFDYMYVQSADGTYRPTSSLITFRELIDGVEQMDFSQSPAYQYVNEELIAGGTTLLATSFYGRDGLHASDTTNLTVMNGQPAINYATGTVDTRTILPGYYAAPTVDGVLMRRLLNSEKLMGGSALGSVIDFFSPFNTLAFTETATEGSADDTRGYFPVTGSCQPNWLIVFTGGNEKAIPGRDPVQSLLNLYENSETMRGRHWDGSKWVHRSYLMDNPIRTIFVGMVSTINASSDGNPYAPDLPTDSGAKRLRKTIRRMAHAGQPHYVGGSLTPDTSVEPYFADNVPALLGALQSILQNIRAERFASGAPVVLPSDDGGDNRSLFTASYEINMLKQWTGSLHRFDVPDDPSQDSTLVWKAEAQIDAGASTRSVYTTTGTAETSGNSVADIRAMDDSTLSSLTGTPLTDAYRFRDWLLEYTGEQGIMGDTEHSGITLVGAPALSGIASRDTRIYIQTNRGVLHALNYSDGSEAWAFIPPNVFQHRIKDQKFLLGTNWYDGDGSSSIRSRPLVLLDGMLAPHDVTIGGTPKTFMIGAIGWGGNAFYAMDVTAAGSQPEFLWAVDNVRYDQVEVSPIDGVKRWGAAAGGAKTNYDYSDLGLTIAAPELRTTAAGDVGILPGGLGYNFGADSQGKAFYIFDPQNGSIIRKIATGSGYVGLGQMGMGIAPVSYITQGSDTVEFFTGDSEGNVLHCDTTGAPSGWNLTSIFRLRTTANKPIALTKALKIGKTSAGDRWLFGGTSDLMVPDFSATRMLENDEQYIFGLNLNKVIGKSPVATLADLVELKYLRASPDVVPSYGDTGSQVPVPAGSYGWTLKLRPKMTHPTEPTDAEYVTTSPFLYAGVLYVSTFIPKTRHPDDLEKCPELGDSKFYALDPLTGAGKWTDGSQAKLFSNIKISGISASRGRLFIGIKVLRSGAVDNLKNDEDLKGLRKHGEAAIDIGAPGYVAPGSDPDVTPYLPHLQYWRESF